MKSSTRVITSFLIIIPVVVLGLISIGPHSLAVVAALQSARLAVAQERYKDAVVAYQNIIEIQPERKDLWDTIGGLAYQAGDYAAAIDAYQRAEKAGTITSEGWFTLSAAYLNLGETREANETLHNLIGQPGLNSAEYAELVSMLRKSRDFEGALQAAQAWFLANPREHQAAYAYGLFLSYMEPAEALDVLLPVSISDFPQAGNARILLQGIETAANHEQKEYGLVVIGQRLLEVQEFDLAKQAFLRAVDLNPAYAEAWAMLSEAQQTLGEDGWPALEEAQRLNPTSEIVRAELALFYRRQGKPERALPYLHALARAHPREASWLIEIGDTLTEQGNLIDAMSYYQQATSLEPENAATWRALAAFSAENGYDADTISIPAAQKALDQDADDPQSLDLMGWILLVEGDLEKAEHFLQLAVEKDASNPRALLHLAQVYLEMNRLSLAYEPLRQAAVQTADPTTALQAQRLLEKYFPSQP